jgi:4-hydroxy-tetrahydrodipicolinate synthase
MYWMISSILSGLGTALITPFNAEGAVDLSSIAALAERQVAGGVDFLVPCGTTGEAVTLSDDEYRAVLETVVRTVSGRVPVIAGAGTNATDHTIRKVQVAAECGVDAALIVAPYYNKPSQEGYFRHFEAVAQASPLPVVIYNVPGRTGGNMTAATQLRIARLEKIIATKEASGDLSQIMHIVAERPKGFMVFSGDDNLALPHIAAGCDGLISVVSNELPAETAMMIHSALAGDFAEARTMHYRLLGLMEANFIEPNPGPVKCAMAFMGLIEERYRLPLVPLTEENRMFLRTKLKALGIV